MPQKSADTQNALSVIPHTQPDDLSPRRPDLILMKYVAMPFHHLIPARLLSSDPAPAPDGFQTLPPPTAAGRLQSFWRSLAARGVTADEAVLLDDSIECSFVELYDRRLIRMGWEVAHYNALAGCAELYLAEMFLCKRRIYEGETDEVMRFLRFAASEVMTFLPETVFTPELVNDAVTLFAEGLVANYTLAVSAAALDLKRGKVGTKTSFEDLFRSLVTVGDTRVYSWITDREVAEDALTKFYDVRLSPYWTDWRSAARRAHFDFDFLATLTDARLVRFYELTKILRAIDTQSAGGSPPKKLEIRYGDFVQLMPLPHSAYVRDIKGAIGKLVNPLKQSGYLKSWTIKPEQFDRPINNTRLRFQFND